MAYSLDTWFDVVKYCLPDDLRALRLGPNPHTLAKDIYYLHMRHRLRLYDHEKRQLIDTEQFSHNMSTSITMCARFGNKHVLKRILLYATDSDLGKKVSVAFSCVCENEGPCAFDMFKMLYPLVDFNQLELDGNNRTAFKHVCKNEGPWALGMFKMLLPHVTYLLFEYTDAYQLTALMMVCGNEGPCAFDMLNALLPHVRYFDAVDFCCGHSAFMMLCLNRGQCALHMFKRLLPYISNGELKRTDKVGYTALNLLHLNKGPHAAEMKTLLNARLISLTESK